MVSVNGCYLGPFAHRLAANLSMAIGSILKAHMSIEIRIAVVEDAFAACDVLRRSIVECCLLDHRNEPAILDAWLVNKTPGMVANWFASTTNFSLVAIDDGVLVGVALLTRGGKVSLCYLLPEAQYRGIGLALLTRIEAQAIEWSIRSLQLHSTATAAAFYARHGYIRSGQVRSPYGVETTFFWKSLDPDASIDATRTRFCNCNMGNAGP
jgi:GNAT superfamily N-acetyltransferase